MRGPSLSSLTLVALAACGSGTEPVARRCESAPVLPLAEGAVSVVEPGAGGCLRLSAGREWIVAFVSADGRVTADGTAITIRGELFPSAAATARLAATTTPPAPTLDLHASLRAAEAALPRAGAGADAGGVRTGRAVHGVPAPVRVFQPCADAACATRMGVTADLAYTGTNVSVYLERGLPPADVNANDLAVLGPDLDGALFTLDTSLVAAPTDVDGDGRVAVLVSRAVNALSGACRGGAGLVQGYVFGGDLLPSAGAGRAEVVYLAAPDPSNAACRFARQATLDALPRTFVHELQHLLNFGERVVRRGGTAEATWLNEAMSHLAEELAGRRLSAGRPDADAILARFALPNLQQAYDYLGDPAAHWLVVPGTSTGRPEERGAGWLFLRWLVDRQGGDAQAPALLRALVRLPTTGAASVAATAATPFPVLVGTWHLANVAAMDRTPVPGATIGYTSWTFRTLWADLRRQDPGRFPLAFPLRVDSVGTAGAIVPAQLRDGSARLVRVTLTAPAELAIAAGDATGQPLPAGTALRLAVLRVR
ncbi:MAG: hypothetical protein NW201_07850 [Gemmatimonadales bacterium]|nr:hypothetical protein [Gemmatimonadales bacterium]